MTVPLDRQELADRVRACSLGVVGNTVVVRDMTKQVAGLPDVLAFERWRDRLAHQIEEAD